jgi:hypothetical protein
VRLLQRRSASLRLPGIVAIAWVALLFAPALAGAATQEASTQFSVNTGLLTFLTDPAVPTLGPITLTGGAQTVNATMDLFSVIDATGAGSGWNVTAEGRSGSGKSPIFAEYCPKAKCGSDAEGYVGGGQTLPADSLTLNSSGAEFLPGLGGSGSAPTLRCATGCGLDSVSPEKIASAVLEAGLGTWLTAGFSTSSIALAIPTTVKVLPSGEIYRVNLTWTLSVGP